ncbi:transglycosylase domain-containing protein [Jatrophihabitans sp. DSM 45814]
MARASGLTILSKLAKLAALIVVTGVLAAGVVVPYVGGAGLAAKAGADKFLDTTCNLTEEPLQQKTTLLANDGKTVIATLFDQNRQVVPLTSVPKAVTNALISTEDRRFYQHHGVDIRGLIRGALNTSNGDTQGASTLTEQYVKQVNYYNAISAGDQAAAEAAIDQNINRKIADAQCALKIEKQNTKAQILEKYLNIAFFGENSYGIQTAAQTYFGVDVSKLTLAQSALLVGLVKSPSAFDPFQDPDAAIARRNLVLDNMLDQKYITPAQDKASKGAVLKLAARAVPERGCAFAGTKPVSGTPIANAGFFCDYVVNWLTSVGGFTNAKINTAGLRITTTLDVNLQNAGENAIWTQSGLDPKNSGGYILAMPSVTPNTGAITTMITDLHYGVRPGDASYSVNPVFSAAYAGSGSTYKYFTALTALKAGVDPNFQLTAGDPYTTKNCPAGTGPQGGYHNAGSYKATLPLSLALPESSNTYFVGMEDQLFGCNLAPIVGTATGLGLNALNAVDPTDRLKRTYAQATIQDQAATFTLGQRPTSALELTGAFSALANDGVFCPPTPIVSITDTSGKPVPYKHPGCTRQYDPYVARTLVNIMTNDTHSGYGTAGSFFSNWYNNGGSLVAAKTGTNNSSDANGNDNGGNSALWFVGITPSLTSAAALVNPQNPNQKISNVPGVTQNNDGGDTFGASAANFWLQAYGPTLAPRQWTWQTPDSTPGEQINVSLGQDPATTQAQLTALGFKSTVDNFFCGSNIIAGNIAYYSPKIGVPGSTVVTLCRSSGVPVASPPPPPVIKPTKPPATPVVPTRPVAPPSHGRR